MDLRANAIITAIDRFSGPMAAMGARMDAFVGRASALAAATRRMSGSLAGGGLMSAAVMHQMVEKAEKFNQAVFGVGVASIGEAMDAAGKIDMTRPLGDMAMIEKSAMGMSDKLRLSATTISQIHETLAKAGLGADKLAAAAEATAILSKTDFETPANKMAEFMHIISIIHRPLQGEGFGDFMRRQADMMNIAASETRLSVGGIMEGLRQFQPIGAGMGMKTEEMLALLMAGVRSGFNPIELGTAIKSSMSRAYKPTAPGMFALNSILGPAGKSLQDYTMAGAQDPKRAKSALNSSLGFVKGKFGNEVEKMLYDAYRGGYTTTEAFIQELSSTISKEGGFDQLKDLQHIQNLVRSSILVPGQQVDIIGMWRDFVKYGGDISQFVNYFEGRHLARLLPMMKSLVAATPGEESPFDRDVELLRRAKGQGLDAVETLWSQSSFGNLKAMGAAWERILIRLANSPAIQQFVNSLERLAAAIERADPAVLKIAGWAAVLTAGGATAGLLFAGLATAFTALAAGAAALAAALASPIAAPLIAIAGAAMLLKDGFNPAIVTAFAASIGVLAVAAGPVTASIAALGATAALLMANWEPVKGFFDGLWGHIKSGFETLAGWLQSAGESVTAIFTRMAAIMDAVKSGRFRDAWDMSKGGALPRTSNNDRMEPLARTGTELVRDISAGAQRVDVQGQATIKVDPIRVEVIGPGRVLNPDQQPADQSVPLRTGTSLGDIGAP